MAEATKRLFAWTRQVTGNPRLNHAYVYEGNRVIAACSHAHRSDAAARRCAKKMLRDVQRERDK